MLTTKQFDYLLKKCWDTVINSEDWLRAKALNIKLFDFSVDLKGTTWEDKGIYRADWINSDKRIDLYVDLHYFEYGLVGHKELCTNIFNNYIIPNFESYDMDYFMLDVYYYVISTKQAKEHNDVKFKYLYANPTEGDLYHMTIRFDTEIDMGVHFFTENDNILDWYNIRWMKNAVISCNCIKLSYEHFKEALNKNITFKGCHSYNILYEMSDSRSKDNICELLKYCEKNKDFGTSSIISVYAGDLDEAEQIKWLTDLCAVLSSKCKLETYYYYLRLLINSKSNCDTEERVYFGDKCYVVEQQYGVKYRGISNLTQFFILG